MKKRLILFAAMMVATLMGSAQVRVACIGNSITYGSGIQDREHDTYPAQLQAMLGKGYAVENFGVSGATAQREGDKPWTNQREYAMARDFMPQIVVIKLGTNDTKPQNWVGTERFISNIEGIAKEFEALPTQPRIVIALPAKAYQVKWGIRDSVIVAGELKPLAKMARRNHWRLIDLHKATSHMPERFPDGIHPDPLGAGIIAEKVKRAVLKETKKLR